jgi:hypothetical protein
LSATLTEIDMLSERIERLQEDWQWWNLVPQNTKHLLTSPLTDLNVRQRTLEQLEKNFNLDMKRLQTWAECQDVLRTFGRETPNWVEPLFHRVKPWFTADKRQKVEEAIHEIAKNHRTMIEAREAELRANAEAEAKRQKIIEQHPVIVRLSARRCPLWHRTITTPLKARARKAEHQALLRAIAQFEQIRTQVTVRRHTPARRAA